MSIVRAYSFRLEQVAVRDVSPLEQLLTYNLPIGDGITFHRVRGVFEDGHLLQIELDIGDPVTEERIELGRMRLDQILGKFYATTPRETGLDAGSSDELFQGELNKITGPSGSSSTAVDLIFGLVEGFKGLALAAAVAGAALLILRRR